jgi:hypothetical protein
LSPDWRLVIPVLQTALNELNGQKANVTVVISNHYVRYLMLPWNDVALTDTEATMLLQHRFEEVYGPTSENWTLRLNAGGFGGASLASGIDQEFLTQVNTHVSESSLRLTSIQPYLMSAFNACRKKIGQQKAWLIVAEQGIFCIALLNQGQWEKVRSQFSGSDWIEDIWVALEREVLLDEAGGEHCNVYVYSPHSPLLTTIQRGLMEIQPISINSRLKLPLLDNQLYAMALAGI